MEAGDEGDDDYLISLKASNGLPESSVSSQVMALLDGVIQLHYHSDVVQIHLLEAQYGKYSINKRVHSDRSLPDHSARCCAQSFAS